MLLRPFGNIASLQAYIAAPPMPTPILIVEDEPAIAETLVYALSTDGYAPVWRTTGREALAAMGNMDFALAILDVGLPDINGFDLFRQMQRISDMPVIFLTARSGEVDRIVGLEIGADDYISKPFSPREVCARVRTVLRRLGKAESSAARNASTANQPFVVDDEKKSIAYHGMPLDLSKIEYRLLKTLLERPGRVYSREELMQKAWDHPESSLDRTVDAHIKQLRSKLKAVRADDDAIQTHRGIGYSLKTPA
ncbi:MAG: transcriptional regulator [Paucimonas sp.]|jgi:two-component system catabolic regulation response regulator CreB|nr:transcriptional regulator [Paucimonas sp.]